MSVEKKLTIGKVYEIQHVRKGEFVAQFLGLEETPEGDEADDVFLHMRYDVRQGTAQAGLAVQPKQKVRESLLRPSLITRIEQLEGEHWLQELEVPQPAEAQSALERLRGLLGG